MTARIVTLCSDLAAQLASELEVTVLRRYTPYVGRDQLASERITVFASEPSEEITTRSQDSARYVIGVEVAQSLPKSGNQTDSDPDADINNLTFLDARMATVTSIKDLFRDEGALREELIGGCYFAGMQNKPLYSIGRLVEDRIFSSVVLLTFTYNGG